MLARETESTLVTAVLVLLTFFMSPLINCLTLALAERFRLGGDLTHMSCGHFGLRFAGGRLHFRSDRGRWEAWFYLGRDEWYLGTVSWVELFPRLLRRQPLAVKRGRR